MNFFLSERKPWKITCVSKCCIVIQIYTLGVVRSTLSESACLCRKKQADPRLPKTPCTRNTVSDLIRLIDHVRIYVHALLLTTFTPSAPDLLYPLLPKPEISSPFFDLCLTSSDHKRAHTFISRRSYNTIKFSIRTP
jgi:hypothetical protein